MYRRNLSRKPASLQVLELCDVALTLPPRSRLTVGSRPASRRAFHSVHEAELGGPCFFHNCHNWDQVRQFGRVSSQTDHYAATRISGSCLLITNPQARRPCSDAMISWLLGQPTPSTTDTPANAKHSCWLSRWLSASLNRELHSPALREVPCRYAAGIYIIHLDGGYSGGYSRRPA